MRVLLDTNILISCLLAPGGDSPIREVIRAAILGKFILLMPDELLEEFSTKSSQKPYLSARIRQEEVDTFIRIIAEFAEFIPTILEPIPAVTRDPKDDYLLAYALVGLADCLVTGDWDLLVIGEVEGVRIVTARELLSILTE